jgi:hypothetical protein
MVSLVNIVCFSYTYLLVKTIRNFGFYTNWGGHYVGQRRTENDKRDIKKLMDFFASTKISGATSHNSAKMSGTVNDIYLQSTKRNSNLCIVFDIFCLQTCTLRRPSKLSRILVGIVKENLSE